MMNGACAGRRRVLCYENLGSETGTGEGASWRDGARVAVCGGKDRGKWDRAQVKNKDFGTLQ